MTDIAPEQVNKRHRCGDTREDGKVFWGYQKSCKNGERWVTPEQAEKMKRTNLVSAIRYHYNHPELKEKNALKTKKWRQDNPDKLQILRERSKKVFSAWKKAKYTASTFFRTKCKLRSRISEAFKKKTCSKRTENILGASFQDVCLYLEKGFTSGMTWDNQTKTGWHIDHIIPLSCAKSEEHLKALCHYTNLRPLWGKENLQKHAKIPSEVPENIRHLLPQNWNE